VIIPGTKLEEVCLALKAAGYKKIAVSRVAVCNYPNMSGDESSPEIDGWPAIWRIVEKAGLKSSCGNSHQRQIENWPDISKYELASQFVPQLKEFLVHSAFPCQKRDNGVRDPGMVIDLENIQYINFGAIETLFHGDKK